MFFNITFAKDKSWPYHMVPAINAYLDVLVEDVLPDFGVDSGERIVKEVDVGIGIQRPGEVYLAATDEGSLSLWDCQPIGGSIILKPQF